MTFVEGYVLILPAAVTVSVAEDRGPAPAVVSTCDFFLVALTVITTIIYIIRVSFSLSLVYWKRSKTNRGVYSSHLPVIGPSAALLEIIKFVSLATKGLVTSVAFLVRTRLSGLPASARSGELDLSWVALGHIQIS